MSTAMHAVPRGSAGRLRTWTAARPLATDVLLTLLAGALSLLGAALALQLWDAQAGIPFGIGGDADYTAMTAESMLDDGSPLTDPRLGFPFGLDARDFTVLNGDWLQFATMWLLGRGLDSAISVVSAYAVLTFGLAGMTAFVALRGLGVRRGPSLVCAVLFALTPYHFLRGTSHLMLASSYAVPAGSYLVLRALGRHPLWARRPEGRGLRSFLTPTTGWTAACVVLLVGAGSVYYLLFSVMLLGLGALALLAADRRLRPAWPALAVAGVLVGGLLVAQTPTLVHWAADGGNQLAGKRAAAESEVYALKPLALFLPTSGHRIEAFDAAQRRYYTGNPLPSEGGSQSLGLAGAMGLLWLLVVAAASLAGGRLGRPLERSVSVAAVTAIALGTVGGLSAFIGYFVSAQMRGWNRISIFIAFFGLVAFALLLTRALEVARRRSTTPWRVAAAGLLVAVPVLGWADQTSRSTVPAYAFNAAQTGSDAGFVHAAERLLPKGAAILQLPHAQFPEVGPINAMPDYAHLRGYVHSTDLKFTYAAMKGRSDDWLSRAAGLPLDTLLDLSAGLGIDAVWVDRNGYVDTDLEEALQRSFGAPIAVSRDTRLALYDLRSKGREVQARLGAGAEQRLRGGLRNTVAAAFGAGAFPAETDDDGAFRWLAPEAELTLDNPDDAPRPVLMAARFTRPDRQPVQVVLEGPSGERRTVAVGRRGADASLRVMAPPGRSRIVVRTAGPLVIADAGDARQLAVQLRGAGAVDALLCAGRPAARCVTGPTPQVP
jgi:hypothetical protein